MSNFTDSLQQLVNKDYDELLYLAKKAVLAVIDDCKKVDPDHNGIFMLASIILAAIASDGKLSVIERKFLRDLLNLDDETINKFIAMYDSKMVELVDRFADSLSSETKANVLVLVSTVAACDETISREENAFLHKILN